MDNEYYDGQKHGYKNVIKKIDDIKSFYELKGYGTDTLLTIREYCTNSITMVDALIGKQYKEEYNKLKEKGETNGND